MNKFSQSSIYEKISKKIFRIGNESELKLLEKYNSEFQIFLSYFEPQIKNRRCLLEIGIETELCLKLNVLSKSTIFFKESRQIINNLCPKLNNALEVFINHKVPFHFGFKVALERLAYEIYPLFVGRKGDEMIGIMNEALGKKEPLPCCRTASELSLYFGIDSAKKISKYCYVREKPIENRLKPFLKDVSSYQQINQFRLNQKNQWIAGKSYVDGRPSRPEHIRDTLENYSFPYFAYLYKFSKRAYAIIGKENDNYSFYATY